MARGLATIDALALPGAVVRPSTCEVAVGEQIELLEPRMMQVLVELVEANGRVVSRDELIERCWDGLAVSDDAINRVTARLRRLGQDHGIYTLETIRKVGYRLLTAGQDGALTLADAPATASATQLQRSRFARTPQRRKAMRRTMATAALALVATGAFSVGNRPIPLFRETGETLSLNARSVQQLPGRWGSPGCNPSYDFVVREGQILATAPGYRSQRRIVAADDDKVLAEGILPVAERGRLFELRPDGERLMIQDRTTNVGQVLDVCAGPRR